MGTDEHREIVDAATSVGKAENQLLDGLTITLNFQSNEEEPQKVIELRDDLAIERVLLLLGRKMDVPLRNRDEVLAEEAAKQATFSQVTGFQPEDHRI